MLEVNPRSDWVDAAACVVAASGPSLTDEGAAAIAASGLPVVAVNDAYKRLPLADVLYACDARWWHERGGAREFQGERWSSIGRQDRFRHNDKTKEQAAYGLNLIFGDDLPGFSLSPNCIHYGGNSGFQGVNLALLLGARTIILAGFDMSNAKGAHFFGAHKPPLRNTQSYVSFIQAFETAAKKLPSHIQIVNASPSSALTCFPRMNLDAALAQVANRSVAA